jgi:hypothetical protein
LLHPVHDPHQRHFRFAQFPVRIADMDGVGAEPPTVGMKPDRVALLRVLLGKPGDELLQAVDAGAELLFGHAFLWVKAGTR